MSTCENCLPTCTCPMKFGRRSLLTAIGAGATAMALKTGLLDFASTVVAAEPKPAGKPRVRAVFVRPKSNEPYWMGWPGHEYDIVGSQALYTKIMTEAATKYGVQLEADQEPLESPADWSRLLELVKKDPPDGIIVTLMSIFPWKYVDDFVKQKGDLSAVVFAPLGMAFTGHLQATRNAPKTFVASTQDVGWLNEAVHMLRAKWTIKNTRICVLAGNKPHDDVLPTIGTTLHYLPSERFAEAFDKAETTDEMRQIAEYYTKEAKKTVEPKPQDILNAAKNYVVAKQIMAAENCQGISMDCLGLISRRRVPCTPCIAWSRLLDEGLVGACEADRNAIISHLITCQVLDRPGFQQDPVPNTVTNSFIGAHCTSATKLAGFDKPHLPFNLRNHDESGTSCVPQVFFPDGQPVTVMQFMGETKAAPATIVLGTGRVLGNNTDLPGCGGCRTSVDLEMDNVADSRDVKGFHQLFILGKQDRKFQAYAQLAGIKALPIA